MDIQLLKYLGNIDQIAGVREYQLLRGRGEQIQVAEFYNAAGLRFTVIPDRCMDLFDLSYKGVNLSFQSKNGLVAPQANSAAKGEFTEQWSGGMLVTCGLDNVVDIANKEEYSLRTDGFQVFQQKTLERHAIGKKKNISFGHKEKLIRQDCTGDIYLSIVQ